LTELSNQRRLLRELTDEVNQNVTKAQVLFELCKSISSSILRFLDFVLNKFLCIYSAISADGFNLYLVDETGKNMRLFTTENDE
jgi:hypothetical protein